MLLRTESASLLVKDYITDNIDRTSRLIRRTCNATSRTFFNIQKTI